MPTESTESTPKLHIKPAEGRVALHPDGRPIAADGERVPAGSYYRRLLRHGDVVDLDADKKAKAAAVQRRRAEEGDAAEPDDAKPETANVEQAAAERTPATEPKSKSGKRARDGGNQ